MGAFFLDFSNEFEKTSQEDYKKKQFEQTIN